jgi:hypothetical protein
LWSVQRTTLRTADEQPKISQWRSTKSNHHKLYLQYCTTYHYIS